MLRVDMRFNIKDAIMGPATVLIQDQGPFDLPETLTRAQMSQGPNCVQGYALAALTLNLKARPLKRTLVCEGPLFSFEASFLIKVIQDLFFPSWLWGRMYSVGLDIEPPNAAR